MPRRNMSWWLATSANVVAGALLCFHAVGCSENERADVVPISGKVLLDGKPLEFGTVAFQPMRGQPARGTIGKDGTFKLSTYREGDGAAVGQHRVKITCFTSQDPAAKKPAASETLGESLIPARYTNFDTSGLTVAVLAEGNASFVFELKSDAQEGESAKGGEAKETPSDVAKPAEEGAKSADESAKPAETSPGGPPAETKADVK